MMMARILLLLLSVLVHNSRSHTLVHFSPDQGYTQNLPLAAGFAYAFHAPARVTPKAKSLDSSNGPYFIPAPNSFQLQQNTITDENFPITLNNVNTAGLSHAIVVPNVVKTQYHSQDELGQYAYGYVHNDASHHEERTADGGVTGTFSYYDDDGKKHSANYRADRNGYRVEESNISPVYGPAPVKPTPEVEAATLAHLRAVQEAKSRMLLTNRVNHVGIGDTPEVAAAKAAHLLAYNEIKQRHARRFRRSAHRSYNSRRQSYHYQNPFVPPVPVKPTPEVQQATYQHLKAVDAIHRYGGNINVGIPDTPAVSAARDAHFYAYDKIARDHARRWKRSTWHQYQDNGSYKPRGEEFRFDDGLYRPKGEEYYSDDGQYRLDQHNPSLFGQTQTYSARPQQHFNKHVEPPHIPQVQVYPGTSHIGIADTPEVAAAKAAHHHAFHAIKQDHAKRWKRSTWQQYQEDGSYKPRGEEFRHDDGLYRPKGEEYNSDDGQYRVQHHIAQTPQQYSHNQGFPLRQDDGQYRPEQHDPSLFGQTQTYSARPQQHFNKHVGPPHIPQVQVYPGTSHIGIADTPEVAAAKAAHHHAFHAIKQDHAKRWKRSLLRPRYSNHPNGLLTQSVFQSYNKEPIISVPVLKQYHAQNELGGYEYGYSGGPSAKHEEKGSDGVTRGYYSYIDAYGQIQKVEYEADDYTGFKIISATNLP